MIPAESITREIMGNVPKWLGITFYVAAFAACGIAAMIFIRRLGQYRRAKQSQPRARSTAASVWSVVEYLTFHKELRRDRYAGMAHMLMFYGFFILFIGTCLVFLEHDTPLHFFYGRFYIIASLIIDLGGVAFIAGLVMFASRRIRREPGRFLRQWWVSSLLALLLLIGLSGFVLEAARIAIDMPAHEKWSAVGYALATMMRAVGIEGDAARELHRVTWGTHAVLCVTFFALLPWRFFGHMTYGAASWATRAIKPIAQLRTPPKKPGAATWEDLGWRDLLQADACTTCGRCNDVCPAHAAGKPLRPREVILNLRGAIGQDKPLHQWVDDDTLWSCTTCGACNNACPVGIDIYDKIVEMRRGRVESGDIPEAAATVFEQNNPFGKPDSERMNWAAGLPVPVAEKTEQVELLYWIGCAGSFDPDGKTVAQAMVKILNHININYRVLGKRECCTGDPARRMGEEGLFQQQAKTTIERLAANGVKRILTHCPHCFNSFKNEYPALGAMFEVEHHSQFLARMIDEGRLSLPNDIGQKITFHDPCYLGRGNGETESPRKVLMSLPQLKMVEMGRSGKDSFCCGAGGGAMWLDVPGQQRVENIRAQEAAATGATTVATGCPFCKSMLTAGQQSATGQPMEVKDLAELIVLSEGIG